MSDEVNEGSAAMLGSVAEPVAWAVEDDKGVFAVDLSITEMDRRRERGSCKSPCRIIPLYGQPQLALTREEMKAIQRAADKLATQTPTWQPDVVSVDHEGVGLASVLRGLLERIK